MRVSSKEFTSPANNNKMERINGEIRDREKTMRGLKKKDTEILDELRKKFMKALRISCWGTPNKSLNCVGAQSK